MLPEEPVLVVASMAESSGEACTQHVSWFGLGNNYRGDLLVLMPMNLIIEAQC